MINYQIISDFVEFLLSRDVSDGSLLPTKLGMKSIDDRKVGNRPLIVNRPPDGYVLLYHISSPRSGEGLERGRPARLCV
jgi:hypothetical protein